MPFHVYVLNSSEHNKIYIITLEPVYSISLKIFISKHLSIETGCKRVSEIHKIECESQINSRFHNRTFIS